MEKSKAIELLNGLNQLEIKGQNNVLLVYRMLVIVQNELAEIEKKENTKAGG